jgi:hypothetical protein
MVSITPLQSLYFINDPFVHEQSERIAARILEANLGTISRIENTYVLLLGRNATQAELTAALSFLKRAATLLDGETQVWSAYARAILRLNEFIYID